MTINKELLCSLLDAAKKCQGGAALVLFNGKGYSYNGKAKLVECEKETFPDFYDHAMELGDLGYAKVRDLGKTFQGPIGVAIDRVTSQGRIFLDEYQKQVIENEQMQDCQTQEASRIFFSYDHEDESFRDELAKHLTTLQREGIISTWHDREIAAGQEWKQEILKQLNQADIILLLISADFIASDFCWDIELELAMKRHERMEAVVIPIIVRESDWQGTPFAKLQALPRNAKPIDNWEKPDQAYTEITRRIRQIAQSIT